MNPIGAESQGSAGKAEIKMPIIKGVHASKIIRMLAKGHHYQDICDRYPSLDWPDINEAVHFRNHVLVPARLAEGKTPREIAREFGFSLKNVSAIKRQVAQDKELQEHWGGLPARIVAIIRRTWHCRDLAELQKKFPVPKEQDLSAFKGIGLKTVQALREVLSVKPSEPGPAQNIPPVYITKSNHLRGVLWETMPSRHAWEITRFFHAIVKSARALPPDEKGSTRVPCMAGPRRKWCLGIIEVCRIATLPEMHWSCPLCGKGGIIKDSATIH